MKKFFISIFILIAAFTLQAQDYGTYALLDSMWVTYSVEFTSNADTVVDISRYRGKYITLDVHVADGGNTIKYIRNGRVNQRIRIYSNTVNTDELGIQGYGTTDSNYIRFNSSQAAYLLNADESIELTYVSATKSWKEVGSSSNVYLSNLIASLQSSVTNNNAALLALTTSLQASVDALQTQSSALSTQLQDLTDYVNSFLPIITTLDAPVLVSATADGDSANIKLIWTASGQRDSILIQRALTGSGAYTQIDHVDSANISYYRDVTTLGGTGYDYRLIVRNGDLYSPYSNVLSATTIDTSATPGVKADYYVSPWGGGDTLATVAEVNLLSLTAGDTVAFLGGSVFADAPLTAKSGAFYTSYGTDKAIIGDSTSSLTTNPTITINVENVTLHNLKIYGYRDALKVITFSLGDLTIDSCEIIGGQDAHANDWTYGIYQTNHDPTGADDVTITYSKFHGIGFACIYWAFPYNWNVSYNEFYDLWMDNGKADWGGCVIAAANTITESGEEWDCNYTVNVHHNVIHDFEYATISVPSRGIVEYNEIYDNLDERLYFGGVKHGDVGKLWDGYRMGQVFRYNYVHDLYIYGDAGYTYDAPTDEQRAAGTPNVTSTNNGTDHPIYLNAGSGGYGTHFGDATGENPENLLGGQGYGNFWIHNNIFYNCTKGITDRGTNYYPGTTTQLPYDSTKACYFINNTIINCGIWTYGTLYNSLVFSHAAAQSPQKSMNNIYHYGDVDGATAIYYWEKDSYSHNDIFISPLTGTHYGVPDLGDNFAITGNYSADDISISGQQYAVSQSAIWNDTSATVLCDSIGISGAYIPDVRIKVGSAADSTGKAWNLLGDNYTVSSVLVEWVENHTLGQDPTGRSFAYDIFGTLRTRNIIGAVKRVGD